MPNRGIIFVGGIHGVGKSTFCSKLSAIFGLKHYSAGEIIKRHLASDSRDKRVQDVGGNQEVLIATVEEIVASETIIFLDGHFCVFDSSGKAARIPGHVFKRLSPVAVLVMHDDVSNIAARLQSRDANAYSHEALTHLQDAEISHARTICSAIGKDLCLLNPSMHSEAERFIAEHLKIRL